MGTISPTVMLGVPFLILLHREKQGSGSCIAGYDKGFEESVEVKTGESFLEGLVGVGSRPKSRRERHVVEYKVWSLSIYTK